MFIIYERINGKDCPIRNEHGYITQYDNALDAYIERCYYQPDYDNLLIVKKG